MVCASSIPLYPPTMTRITSKFSPAHALPTVHIMVGVSSRFTLPVYQSVTGGIHASCYTHWKWSISVYVFQAVFVCIAIQCLGFQMIVASKTLFSIMCAATAVIID
jgi:hypothetical protein